MKRRGGSPAADRQWWLLYALFALSPVLVLRSAAEPFHLPKATYIIVMAIVVAVTVVYRATAERTFSLATTPFLPLYLLYLGAAGIVTATSAALRISLWGEYRYFTGLVLLLAVGIVVIAMLQDREKARYRKLAYAVVIGAAPVAFYGLLQLAGLDPFEWFLNENAPGAFSTMGNPNFLAGYLAVTFPLTLFVVAAPAAPGWARVAAATLAAAMVVGGVASRSAQGPVGLLIGSVLPVGVAVWQRLGPEWLRRAVVGAGVLVAGAAAAAWSALGEDVVYGFEQRAAIWQGALSIFQSRPVAGSGLATFGLFFGRYRPAEHARIGFTNPEQAHNVALNHVAEGGLLLFVPWVATAAVVGFLLYRGIRQLRGEPQLLMAGFGGAWLAYHTQAFVSIDLPAVVLLHWASAGAIASLSPGSRSRSVWSPGTRMRGMTTSAKAVRAGVVLAAIALALIVIQPLRADIAALSGFRAVNQGQAQVGVERLETATELAPSRSTYWLLLATVREGRGDLEGALLAMEHAARADAGSSRQALQAGEWADRHGDLDRAIAWYEEALERDPLNPQVVARVSEFYDSVGEFERAAELEQLAQELRDAGP